MGSSIRGYDLTYDLDPWKNVLRVRRELARIRDTASNLTKGSLWERNKVYERYRNLIREFDWQSFPSRYDARVERQQLREVSRLIMNRSREIFRDASEDWLPGWGGRVMPVDVLDPWLRFLRKLRERSTHSGVTSTVKELLESTETFRRELTGNSD